MTYQAYAFDASGAEVGLGPSLSIRRAAVNVAINHKVQAVVRDQDGTVTDVITWTASENGAVYTHDAKVPETDVPATFYPPRRAYPSKRVTW
jgi:hypothetical protein